MLDAYLGKALRFFGLRRVSRERQPEVRHVRMGNVTAGVNVSNPEEMLKIATVWRCVNLLGNSVATLPWNVVRVDPVTGNRVRFVGHTVETLLNTAPNPEMTAFNFRVTLMQHRLLYGNFYAEIERDERGRPVALWPIAPDRVEPWRDFETGELLFRVSQPAGGVTYLTQRDVFHVPGMAWDGIRGYSVLEVGMQSLGAAYAMDRFAGGYFGSGMQPSAVVEIPPGVNLSPDDMARLSTEFENKHRGWRNAQAPLILDQGMTYKQTMADPDKGQFLDTRKYTVRDVCRWFGVPPYLAFASDEEPRSNVETQSREFLMYGLDPHIVSLEQEANRKLFVAPNFATRMNTDEFMRGDLVARSQYYTAMRHLGVFSVNEIRAIEGVDGIGTEGDVRVMQVQFQPIGPDGAPTSPNAGAAGAAGVVPDEPVLPVAPPAARMNGAHHEH